MFDKALITRVVGNREGLDWGTLAETIFFYGSTHLLLNHSSVVSLAQKLSPDDLLAFLDRSEVRLSYLRPTYAVHTTNPLGVHKFMWFRFEGDKQGNDARRPRLDHREEIAFMLKRALGDSQSTRKLAKQIADRVKLHTFKHAPGGEDVIAKLTEQDAQDPRYVHSIARTVLEHHLPPDTVPRSFRFRLIDVGKGYAIDTDLDYQRLNAAYHQRVPPSDSTITDAFLLRHALDGRIETYFAAEYMAELVTTPLQDRLIRIKHYDFLRARDRADSVIDHFKDITLSGFPSIREAINTGDRSIADFLRLLDKAQKFKEWLRRENPDSELLADYVEAATAETWAEKLPAKAARWAILTSIEAALGTITGAAVGALDALYLDKLIRGWRPSHFIEGPYRDFVSRPEEG